MTRKFWEVAVDGGNSHAGPGGSAARRVRAQRLVGGTALLGGRSGGLPSDVASRPLETVSPADATRALLASERFRRDHPDIFASRPDGFASSRARGNALYFRDLAEMRAAGLDAGDLAARERAVAQDPDNRIAYLRKLMAELDDAAHERATRDYTRYAVERLESQMSRQLDITRVGREVERLERPIIGGHLPPEPVVGRGQQIAGRLQGSRLRQQVPVGGPGPADGLPRS